MSQQLLDEQAQKVLESLHAALMDWAEWSREARDYAVNVPTQCLHPVGHWYELPKLIPDQILSVFGLTCADLENPQKVTDAVRSLASRMPIYSSLTYVKKSRGKGQEDVYPTLQFEKLWGDMTAAGVSLLR